MKSYFYLDTNVYRRLIEGSDRIGVTLLKKHHRRFRLSFIMLEELIEDLRTCSPEKFDLRKQTVELARQVGGQKIMAAPGEFVAKHLFKTSYANPYLAVNNLSGWLEVAVRFKNQGSLTSSVRRGVLEMGLDVSSIAGYQKNLRDSYISRMEHLVKTVISEIGPQPSASRGGPLRGEDALKVQDFFESQKWKRSYMRQLGALVGATSLNDETLDKLYPSLEAACKLISVILRQSLCEGYRYERRASDRADEVQLYYLCDQSLIFVTNDDRLRRKIQGCSQSQRVISFNKLREKLEHAV